MEVFCNDSGLGTDAICVTSVSAVVAANRHLCIESKSCCRYTLFAAAPKHRYPTMLHRYASLVSPRDGYKTGCPRDNN
jgi:hypothetical protein